VFAMPCSITFTKIKAVRYAIHKLMELFIGFAYQGKDIVLRFIIEYSSLRDFGPPVIGLLLYEDF
jgi:hypothetical protein